MCQNTQKSPVARADSVIHIRYRYLRAKKIQHRKQHRPYGVEGLGKCHVRIFFLTKSRQNIQKIIAHKKSRRVIALILEHIHQNLPVRRITVHHVGKCLFFIYVQRKPVSLIWSYFKCIIKKHLMNSHYVLRKLILIYSLVACVRANNPQHKFMLWHRLNILMHPGRYPTKGVGITSLKY